MTRWANNASPNHITFPSHGSAVVTALIFSSGRIISASDDHSIQVHSPETGALMTTLDGHEGGVWGLGVHKDTLVSGSTDRTIRIWDIPTGKCTHIFGGHTSTVRCLAIVMPEIVNVEKDGGITKEKWPKRPLIVSGSRDHTLRVWTLPRVGEPEFGVSRPDDAEIDPDKNPYHRKLLEGHEHAVRSLAAQGRPVVSGSYDNTVRVWDTVTGECRWTMVGHTSKVYSVAIDPRRHQVYSGGADGTVRIWDLQSGQIKNVLEEHTSLVGLITISPSFLLSGSADATIRIWDPDSGKLLHTLSHNNGGGAVTCMAHDDFKVIRGSDGVLSMWNVRDGTFIRNLLTGITGVWQVAFEGKWCATVSNRADVTVFDVWDFGQGDVLDEKKDSQVVSNDLEDYDDEDGPKAKLARLGL